MAKTSMVNRETRRSKLVARHANKRAALKAVIIDPKVSFEVQQDAIFRLQKLPRDSSPVRSAAVVPFPAARGVFTASLDWAVTNYVKPQCAVTCLACARPVGKEDMNLMSMSDPISDMLTRIRNAQSVRKNDRAHACVKGKDRHCRSVER